MSELEQTLTRSRRDELLSAAVEAPEELDMTTSNLLSHSARVWGLKWTWEKLVARLKDMQGILGADQIWDLRQICQAGQHECLNPAACHAQMRPGHERLSRAFRLTCQRMWLVYTHPPSRYKLVASLERYLSRIQQFAVKDDD